METPTELRTGLNPYGLTYYLGLQARGTPRANPDGKGLEGFIALCTELGAETIEAERAALPPAPDLPPALSAEFLPAAAGVSAEAVCLAPGSICRRLLIAAGEK